jgi:hypothetical protein
LPRKAGQLREAGQGCIKLALVAQIFNLPYRRVALGQGCNPHLACRSDSICSCFQPTPMLLGGDITGMKTIRVATEFSRRQFRYNSEMSLASRSAAGRATSEGQG